ncbi:MAG: hypothetical protein H6557_11995 [Lewinellaceae bacterium]|nr:hypothetical protein [Phaeodactylibacter sp.]MCB9037331.1 hypothetical protein [Lewinellaceae bacterium]
MRKIIFYISLAVSILLFLHVLQILVSDFHRLTEYGFGFLTGKVVWLLVFVTIAVFMRRKIKMQRQEM